MKIPKRIRAASGPLVLYAGMALSLVLSIGTSVINTHILGAEEFGKFKYIQTYWLTTITLTTFGLYSTGSFLHVNEPQGRLPERLGALSIIAILLSMFATLIVSTSTSAIAGAKISQVEQIIIYFSPLLIGVHLQTMLGELLRASKRPYLLIATTVTPQFAYLVFAISTSLLKVKTEADTLLAAYLICTLLTSGIIVFAQRPKLRKTRLQLRQIATKNKAIGIKIYLSTILTTVSANAFTFIYGSRSEFNELAQFSLALTISAPLVLGPNAFANAQFRDFAGLSRLPRKQVTAVCMLSALTLLLFVILAPTVIAKVYPTEFSNTATLAIICGIGSTVHGIGDIFNRFLLSKGNTASLLRNSMLLTAATVLIGTPIAIKFGAIGASISKTLIDILYLVSIYIQYQRIQREPIQ